MIDNLLDIMRVHLFTPTGLMNTSWGYPAMLWGPPGIGKTAIVEQYGASMGPVRVLSPGLQGDAMFGVIPAIKDAPSGRVIHYPQPEWTVQYGERFGIVFVDEITTANPALQAPLLGLIQKKMVGDTYLGDHTRIVCAGNPPSMAAGGFDLAPPALNRMAHYHLEASGAAFSRYMMLDAPVPAVDDPQDLEAKVLAAWPSVWPDCRKMVVDYIKANPEHLHKMTAEPAWASPRSWEACARLWCTSQILGIGDLYTFAAATVGPGIGAAFVAYVRSMDLPSPESVICGAWELPPTLRMDHVMAIANACVEYCRVNTDQDCEMFVRVVVPQLRANYRDVLAAIAPSLVSTKLTRRVKSSMATTILASISEFTATAKKESI